MKSETGSANTTDNRYERAVVNVKIVFFLILSVTILVMLYYFATDRSNPVPVEDPVFIDEWTVTDPAGNVTKADKDYRVEKPMSGEYTMEATLPDNIHDDSYFCFIVGGSVSVYIDDVLRKDFIESRDIKLPGGCVKRFYMMVPVGRSDSGVPIKLVRPSTGRRGNLYQETFVATFKTFYSYMTLRYAQSFLLSEVLFVFSIVIAIISFAMKLVYRHRIEMLYGALSIAIISGWTITNSYLFPFVYGHYHIDGIVNYIFCLMLPFNLLFYLDALQHGRHRKIISIVLGFSLINLIGWPVLHFTGIFPFPRALAYIDAALVLEILIIMGVLICEAVTGKIREYRYTAIGFVSFLICGILEVVILLFIPTLHEDIPMILGLGIMLALSVVQQMEDTRRIRDERQEAVALSAAKTKFLASMSHEIRTPINAVLGMNEMILRENTDPVIDDYAQNVKSSGQMLLMLVNDVLDFSKIEAGKMEISCASFHMSDLLRNIMSILTERADEKHLVLKTEIVSDIPDGLVSDEFRIKQILINLISNAIKYTDSGSVTLIVDGTYTTDDMFNLKMTIKDTGRGITEEDQKHLFEAFTRADITKNRNIEGTGLGLAIVKSIVDSMNGTISVNSTYGEGSEFIIVLPVGVYDRETIKKDFLSKADPVNKDKSISEFTAPDANVLAVDDNALNLKIVRSFLKRTGIVPDICSSGSDAIKMCQKKHYDIILLDHMMPDPDGIETLRLIRADQDSLNKDTTAVVLTANAFTDSRQIYTEAGFADYLTKPLDSSLLEETIKKYLPADKIIPV